MHSVDYDKPEDYKDQVVAILGAKSSGVDISMDLSKFAKKIYLIHLGEKSGTKYPDNIEEIKGTITACSSDGSVEIDNGKTLYTDVVMFCTGYLQTLPFLDPKCEINVSMHNHVTPLYKHIFNIQYPSMSFIGICVKLCPFPNYALQAKLVWSVLTGRTTLPSKEEMLQDEQKECQKRIEAGMAKKHDACVRCKLSVAVLSNNSRTGRRSMHLYSCYSFALFAYKCNTTITFGYL